jgi:predicted XRE-type DNA-binding protein
LHLLKSTAIEWQVRHEVTEEIIKAFASNEMTITVFAKRAETSRARITRILKRDTSDISLDVLFRVLGATGQKIEIKFSKTA